VSEVPRFHAKLSGRRFLFIGSPLLLLLHCPQLIGYAQKVKMTIMNGKSNLNTLLVS